VLVPTGADAIDANVLKMGDGSHAIADVTPVNIIKQTLLRYCCQNNNVSFNIGILFGDIYCKCEKFFMFNVLY